MVQAVAPRARAAAPPNAPIIGSRRGSIATRAALRSIARMSHKLGSVTAQRSDIRILGASVERDGGSVTMRVKARRRPRRSAHQLLGRLSWFPESLAAFRNSWDRFSAPACSAIMLQLRGWGLWESTKVNMIQPDVVPDHLRQVNDAVQDRAAGLIAALQRMAPLIQEQRDAFDRLRRMPDAVFAALADAGLFRLWLPRAIDGPELSPFEFMRVVEAASALDGSVGWLVGNGGGMSRIGGYVARAVARDWFSDPRMFVASATGAVGTA